MGAGLLGVIAFGGAIGAIMATAVPTTAAFSQETSEQVTTPEDYPELVGVSYEGNSGAYFSPKAYSGIAPIIRDNVYDIPYEPESDANQDINGDQGAAQWHEDELPPADVPSYDVDITDGFDQGAF